MYIYHHIIFEAVLQFAGSEYAQFISICITVLIWGSTWLAIEYQLGEVAVEVSLVYRFAIAAVLILMISSIKKLPMRFNLKSHSYFALLGLLNFSFNYLVLYKAQEYLTSAMTSIGFSLLLVVNIINARIFFGKKIEHKTYGGAALGILGIVVLFWPEIALETGDENTLYGLSLVFAGIVIASLGNMVSVRNSNHQLPVFQGSGYGMLYGTLFLLLTTLISGAEFNFSYRSEYWLSLMYLSVFGTVIAFYSYFVLLKNIGPEKASYSIVMFPVVAVILSSLFEGFVWTSYTVAGFLLVAAGNLIVLIPKESMRLLTRVRLEVSPHHPTLVSECVKNTEARQPS